MTATLPFVAFTTVPNGTWRRPVSSTKVSLPGSFTSTVPETGARLPVAPSCGAGSSDPMLERTPPPASGMAVSTTVGGVAKVNFGPPVDTPFASATTTSTAPSR